jgi:hypothetical protein
MFGKGDRFKNVRQHARCRENEQEMIDKPAALEAWRIAARESDSPYTYETTIVQGYGDAIAAIRVRMFSAEYKFLGYIVKGYSSFRRVKSRCPARSRASSSNSPKLGNEKSSLMSARPFVILNA